MVLNVETGESFEDTANILISAKGGLNQISWPKIKGLKSFGGKLMHSGAWDEELVFPCRCKSNSSNYGAALICVTSALALSAMDLVRSKSFQLSSHSKD